MTIRKKIEKTSTLDIEDARDEIILKGGKVAADSEEEIATKRKIQWTNLCLRITTNMVGQIDFLLEERIGISRTAWILEAIQEKLKKDGNKRD
jgi:hypothetical protein